MEGSERLHAVKRTLQEDLEAESPATKTHENCEDITEYAQRVSFEECLRVFFQNFSLN